MCCTRCSSSSYPVGLHLTSHVISGSRGVHVSSDLHLHAYLHAPLSVLVYYILLVCWCISMYYLLVGLLLVMELLMMLVMELLMVCVSLAVGLYLTSCWSRATHLLFSFSVVMSCANRCSAASLCTSGELP